MICNCKPCGGHYPLRTYVGKKTTVPLKEALGVCGRCKQEIECKICRSDENEM